MPRKEDRELRVALVVVDGEDSWWVFRPEKYPLPDDWTVASGWWYYPADELELAQLQAARQISDGERAFSRRGRKEKIPRDGVFRNGLVLRVPASKGCDFEQLAVMDASDVAVAEAEFAEALKVAEQREAAGEVVAVSVYEPEEQPKARGRATAAAPKTEAAVQGDQPPSIDMKPENGDGPAVAGHEDIPAANEQSSAAPEVPPQPPQLNGWFIARAESIGIDDPAVAESDALALVSIANNAILRDLAFILRSQFYGLFEKVDCAPLDALPSREGLVELAEAEVKSAALPFVGDGVPTSPQTMAVDLVALGKAETQILKASAGRRQQVPAAPVRKSTRSGTKRDAAAAAAPAAKGHRSEGSAVVAAAPAPAKSRGKKKSEAAASAGDAPTPAGPSTTKKRPPGASGTKNKPAVASDHPTTSRLQSCGFQRWTPAPAGDDLQPPSIGAAGDTVDVGAGATTIRCIAPGVFVTSDAEVTLPDAVPKNASVPAAPPAAEAPKPAGENDYLADLLACVNAINSSGNPPASTA